MPESDKTLEHLIVAAIDTECTAAGIYQTFSENFAQVPGMTAFWQSLNRDELEHAAILKDTRNLLTPEQLSAKPAEKMWDHIAAVRRMFDQHPASEVKTLDEAYELAHELESSETNAIFRFLAADCVPSWIRKELVHSVLEKHLKKLENFSENFGDREWRRAIKKKA